MNQINNRNTSNISSPSILPKTPNKREISLSMCQTPRCSLRRPPMATAVRSRSKTPRSCYSPCTPMSQPKSMSPFLGEDRFIPNRSRVDTPRARKALLEESREQHDDIAEDDSEYKRQLRRTLFSDDYLTSSLSSTSNSFLGLASAPNVISTLKDKSSSTIQPMDLDVLRSTRKQTSSLPALPRKVDLKRCFTWGASGINIRDDLHVISVGTCLAVGIWDSVVFGEWGIHSDPTAPILPRLSLEHMGSISALQWRHKNHIASSSKYVIAVGGYDSVEVHDVNRQICLAQLRDHMDPVTSIEWIHSDGVGSDFELLASSSVGISRYDLRLPMPEVFTYNTGNGSFHDAPAAKMQLQPGNGFLLAAAVPTKNIVALWDLRYSRVAMQTLEHDSVKGLEFCPLHRNALASGGKDGLRLWNVQSGAVRSTIQTRKPVTTLTWSPHQLEIMAGFGCYLGLWTLSSTFTKSQCVGEWAQPGVGPVVAVERMENGPETCVLSVHGGDGCDSIICWKTFAPKQIDRQELVPKSSTLAFFPVIR